MDDLISRIQYVVRQNPNYPNYAWLRDETLRQAPQFTQKEVEDALDLLIAKWTGGCIVVKW